MQTNVQPDRQQLERRIETLRSRLTELEAQLDSRKPSQASNESRLAELNVAANQSMDIPLPIAAG